MHSQYTCVSHWWTYQLALKLINVLLEECLTLLANVSDPTCRDALSRCTRPACRGKPESPTRCLVTVKLRLYEETTHGTTRSVPVHVHARYCIRKYCVVKYCIHRCNYLHVKSFRKIGQTHRHTIYIYIYI